MSISWDFFQYWKKKEQENDKSQPSIYLDIEQIPNKEDSRPEIEKKENIIIIDIF